MLTKILAEAFEEIKFLEIKSKALRQYNRPLEKRLSNAYSLFKITEYTLNNQKELSSNKFNTLARALVESGSDISKILYKQNDVPNLIIHRNRFLSSMLKILDQTNNKITDHMRHKLTREIRIAFERLFQENYSTNLEVFENHLAESLKLLELSQQLHIWKNYNQPRQLQKNIEVLIQ